MSAFSLPPSPPPSADVIQVSPLVDGVDVIRVGDPLHPLLLTLGLTGGRGGGRAHGGQLPGHLGGLLGLAGAVLAARRLRLRRQVRVPAGGQRGGPGGVHCNREREGDTVRFFLQKKVVCLVDLLLSSCGSEKFQDFARRFVQVFGQIAYPLEKERTQRPLGSVSWFHLLKFL